MLFQDNNQKYNIELDMKVYKEMICYCSISYPYETGGILIGNYSSNQTTANILKILPPSKKSKSTKNTFYRSNDGLIKELDLAWRYGQYYLGEWHYHPNASSVPSDIDRKQMELLSQDLKLKCPEPILIIIGGSQNNWDIDIRLFVNSQEIILKKQY